MMTAWTTSTLKPCAVKSRVLVPEPRRSRASVSLAGLLMMLASACRTAPGPKPTETYSSGAPKSAADDAELARLYDEDQADRTPPAGGTIDWSQVGPRDQRREAEIKALYKSNHLHTAADYHHAAMILQHADEPDDYLLAHELCVVAISMGDASALWLCAASEDRFLDKIGRDQRFGTQFKSNGPSSPFHLVPVSGAMTDELRARMRVPKLEDAHKMEAEINAAQH